MKRLQLFEFEDLPWFPPLLRIYMTDCLRFAAELYPPFFYPFIAKLHATLVRAGTHQIIDLCSGSGGPVRNLVRVLKNRHDFPVSVLLTDLYPPAEDVRYEIVDPSRAAHETGARIEGQLEGVKWVRDSVNATAVPSNLKGCRTLFNALHHFSPENARAILADAARSREAIVVFEMGGRTVLGFLTIVILVALIPLFTLFMRPFRWSRLLFTYVVPLIPFLVLWDGMVSFLRVYSVEHVRELLKGVPSTPDYEWEVGTVALGPSKGLCVIGVPVAVQSS